MWRLCFASLDCIPGGEISPAIVLMLCQTAFLEALVYCVSEGAFKDAVREGG